MLVTVIVALISALIILLAIAKQRKGQDGHHLSNIVIEPDGTALLGNELFDDIVVGTDIADTDADNVVEAVIDFVNNAVSKSLYRCDELPKVARWSYYVDFYACQVDNGGHGQFLFNCDQDPAILADISAGLTAMGGRAYIRLFTDFTTYLAADRGRADAIAAGSGFGEIDPFISDLDDRFYALGSKRLRELNASLVRAYPALTRTAHDDLPSVYARLAEKNPSYAERRAVIDAKIAERDATPMGVAAHAIAKAAGLTLLHWRRGNPRALPIIAIDTATGPFLIKVDVTEALIYSKNGKLPWALFDVEKPGTLIARIPLENGLPRA